MDYRTAAVESTAELPAASLTLDGHRLTKEQSYQQQVTRLKEDIETVAHTEDDYGDEQELGNLQI